MYAFQYKGKGGLTSLMRKRLTSAARCAIKMRSKEADQKKAVKLLEQDLINGPRHCFGIHTHCSSDFCKHTKQGKGSATQLSAIFNTVPACFLGIRMRSVLPRRVFTMLFRLIRTKIFT